MGVQGHTTALLLPWIPACAGMSGIGGPRDSRFRENERRMWQGWTAHQAARPRGSGDPGRSVVGLEIVALDSRFRGNERSVLQRQLFAMGLANSGSVRKATRMLSSNEPVR
jgi:hypothetical protein